MLIVYCSSFIATGGCLMARILLLETDQILAKNLIKYLSKLGYEISWQVDAQSAMDAADQQCPDAIILDFLLANRSGIEFLYEFRSYPEWQNLPVIIFSNIAAEEVSECLEAFEQLNVAAYRYKMNTTLAELAQSLDLALKQPLES
jgi:CheY-like chemotaxis protein